MTSAVGQPEIPVIDPSKLLPHKWKVLLGSGVLAIILGVLMLVWPGKTVLVATVLFGLSLLVFGGAQLFFAMAAELSGGGRALLFLSGAVSVILAVLTFRYSANRSRSCCLPYTSVSASSSEGSRRPSRRSAVPRRPGEVGISSSESCPCWPASSCFCCRPRRSSRSP